MGKRKSNTNTADDAAMDAAMAAFMSMPTPGTKKQKKEKKKKKVVKVVKKTDDNAPPQQALSVIDLFGEDTPWTTVLHAILMDADKRKLKRRDDQLLRPHGSIPGVYVDGGESSVYINSVCHKLPEFHWHTNTMKKFQSWFAQRDHPLFEVVSDAKLRQDVIAFRNGLPYTRVHYAHRRFHYALLRPRVHRDTEGYCDATMGLSASNSIEGTGSKEHAGDIDRSPILPTWSR